MDSVIKEQKEKKCVFLISSTINTPSDTVLGNHKRSIFSMKERFEQSLYTIKSIRDKFPRGTAFIVFLETSDIPTEMKDILRKNADSYIDFSQNKLMQVLSQGKDKGLAEIFMLQKGMRFILESSTAGGISDINFDIIFKLGGRYYLDDAFDINNFDSKTITFREFSNDNFPDDKWFSTMLYGIGWEHRWVYMDCLVDTFLIRTHNLLPDIEHSVRYLLTNKISGDKMKIMKTRIGGSGKMAVNGELAIH